MNNLLAQQVKKSTEMVSGVAVDFIIPDSVKGCILVLPGWNFDKSRWCTETSLCEKAVEQGYALILPQMLKSVYASSFFPETRKDYQQYPQLKWINEELIPFCSEKYEFLSKNSSNYILGLSTGGRGAVLIGLSNPALFKAIAALSGDFDQSATPEDKLMEGYYGKFKDYETRWKTIDNPVYLASQWNTPLYLGHGDSDKIVPVSQTELFYKALVRLDRESNVSFHSAKGYGHDFKYWNSEVDSVLIFFNKH